jgi:Cof subfamily protein (haloacid dehalogenase superfamily)
MDIDGTLAGVDHRLTRRTSHAVRRLDAAGIAAILITGRTEQSAVTLARSLAITAPVIAANGALITDPVTGERLRVARMASSEVRATCAAAARFDLQPIVFTPDAAWTDRQSSLTHMLADVLGHEVGVRSLDDAALIDATIKVMVAGPPDRLDEVSSSLVSALPRLRRSMPEFFEAAPAGASKRDSLAQVLSFLGIDPARCVGIGDGDNDLEWLDLVGRAVAVANARPRVIELADEVIGHHDREGVADFLERALLKDG